MTLSSDIESLLNQRYYQPEETWEELPSPFVEAKKYFPTAIQEFVFYDKYSRFNPELGRRETWPETVSRTVDYLRELSGDKLLESDYKELHDAILNMHVAPSMRLFRVAGEQARRAPESLYNCAYIPMQSVDAIVELLWVSMCGVGVGYSVEERYTNQFPVVKSSRATDYLFVIPDTTEGWVRALHLGLTRWIDGDDISFDFSQIRPAGSALKTKGGTASGPGVLSDLLHFARETIKARSGKRLRPVDIFDICTKVGDAAVSGGSRRSAQLCMFDISDEEMLVAKRGKFWETHPHRANANISVVIEEELSKKDVSRILGTMFDNQTGEPGIISRRAMNLTKPSWRRSFAHGGVNACSEVNLHGATKDSIFGGQFCNLSTVNVRASDTLEDLYDKVRIATVIGTIQAIATNFTLLRPAWREICEEERLLGVSMIGVMDNKLARDPSIQVSLRNVARDTNLRYSYLLGISPAAAITTIKPAGNSSVLYGTARGINARFSEYYIRRVRVNEHTPIFNVLRDSGIPLERDKYSQNGTWVASFYEQSPNGAVTVSEMSALDQLDEWKKAKLNWAEHNVSVTIEYLPEEQDDIINWVYTNQDIVNGIAFLPRTDHVYEQAPYEKLTRSEYLSLSNNYPEIDFSLLKNFETVDTTSRELECSAGVCDLF